MGKHRCRWDDADVLTGQHFWRGFDCIGDHKVLHHGFADTFDRGAGQDAVGDVGMDLFGAVFHQNLGCFAQCASSIYDVINDQACAVFNVADHGHFSNLAGLTAAFVDDGQWRTDPLGQITGTGHTAHVRGYNHHVVPLALEIMHHVERKDRGGIKVINRNIEEALDLCRVQIHG